MLIAETDVAPDVLPDADGWASLEDLLKFEPGRTMVAYLSLLDVDSLDARSASVGLTLVERQQAWLSELAVRFTARVAGPTPVPDPDGEDRGPEFDDWGPYMVGAALGLTTGAAEGRVDVARALMESLPACRLAMAAGAMSYRQAWIVADAVALLDENAKAAVDARVASRISGQSWAAFRRTLRRAVLAAAPDMVLAEHTGSMKHRGVEKFDFEGNVMSQLQVTMSSIDAQTVWLGLDASAWANHALGDPKAPRRHGRRQQVQFITDLPSLLGLADNPAELLGYGPIPAALVRDRATEADWRRLIIEPVTGFLLDHGSVIYRPPVELADYVMARDRRCRFPGCNTRATVCDIDHNIPAPRGATSAKNCCCLCRRHHRLKTFGGWTVQLQPDGSCLWTSPGGRQFVSGPPPQPD